MHFHSSTTIRIILDFSYYVHIKFSSSWKMYQIYNTTCIFWKTINLGQLFYQLRPLLLTASFFTMNFSTMWSLEKSLLCKTRVVLNNSIIHCHIRHQEFWLNSHFACRKIVGTDVSLTKFLATFLKCCPPPFYSTKTESHCFY